MRIRAALLQIAVALTSGCGGEAATTSTGGSDAGAADALPPVLDAGTDAVVPVGCGGCGCGSPVSGEATPAQACAIASGASTATFDNQACNAFCSTVTGGTSVYFCTLPSDYTAAYSAVAGDAGGISDGGSDAGPVCPSWSGNVVVECGVQCLGRRTDGLCETASPPAESLGALFATRAYLEEVSVHAFARLERELAAHRAPHDLLAAARRARRDEIRHTAMTARLARRYGGTPRSPQAPPLQPPRSLFAIALENAVEGCVREAYGAVIALMEARASSDPRVRRAMESVGRDECRHAELAWSVASWILPQLTEAERTAVAEAAANAIDSLAEEGNVRVVAMLQRHVWPRAA
jgi:hypothetical protein